MSFFVFHEISLPPLVGTWLKTGSHYCWLSIRKLSMLKGRLMKMKKEASVEAVRESAGAISSHFPVHCPLSETITLPPVLELRLGGASRGIIIRGQSAMMVISRFIQNIPNFFGKDDGQKPHICCILGRIGKVYDKNILYSPWLDCIHHHLCCLIIIIIIIVTVFRCLSSSTRATAITLKSLNHHKSPVSRLKT